jgi:glycine cleavage system H protein
MDASQSRYTQSHEWASVDGAVATVGISEFAVRTLTDLVYLELPKVGRALKVGDTFGVVESVKAASDLYSPVAGEVLEVNGPLANDLAVLSEDPQGRGWLMKVKLADPSAVASLMDKAAYDKHCESEAH